MTQAEEPDAPSSSRAAVGRPAHRRLAGDDRAVADIVGNFLLIGITVAMMAVLAFFVVSQPPPDNPVSADLKVAGNDTQLKIHHKWGEAVPVGQARLLIELDDGTTEVRELSHQDFAGYVDSERGGIDADFWQIGETICVSCEYVGQIIRRVAVASGNSLLLDWSGNVTAKPDTGPGAANLPPVADFTFNPDGLNVTFNASASSDPEGGALTYAWEFGENGATGPDQVEVNHTYNATGTYQVNLTVIDVDGASDTQSKVVDLSDTNAYLTCPTNPDPGEEIDCFKAQNGLDSDQATFREADVAGTLTNLYGADQVVQAGDWVDPSNALAHDGVFTNATKQDTVLELAFANQTLPGPGSIQRVAITLNVSILGGGGGDSFGVRACFPSGACKDEQTQTVPEDATVNLTFELPAPDHHPGGLATWGWSDVNDLQIRIRSIKSGGSPTWKVDHAWIEVDYSPDPDYAFASNVSIPDVAAGADHTLEIRYASTGEHFDVHVWNHSLATPAYEQVDTLTSASLTTWSFGLNATHHISPSDEVRIRITDTASGDTTRDDLTVSLIRVVTEL